MNLNYENETDNSIQKDNKVKIRGIIEIITFRNEENGYSVFKIHPLSGYDGEMKLIPVTCVIPSLQRGEEVEIEGEFYNHPKYGYQLKVDNIKSILPDTAEGILAILSNGFLPHVGKTTAKRLVDEFGANLFKIMDSEPHKILTIKGISKNKYTEIIESYKSKKKLKDILEYSQGVGIGVTMATKIYDEYGDNSIKIIQKNPYQLINKIKGISFKKADLIASKMGISKDDVNRIKSGLEFILLTQTACGNCAYPRKNLLDDMTEILDVDYSLSEKILEEEIEEGKLKKEEIKGINCIATTKYYEMEQNIANNLLSINREKHSSVNIPENIEEEIKNAEIKNNINLANSQKDAIKNALTNKVCIITGGPGVGKTTIVKSILDILKASMNTVLLAAPTGRAAKRMHESTGFEAKTIHRLLEIDAETGKFKHNETNLLDTNVVIIDETSMVDTSLMNSLLKAIPKTSQVIFVGDIDQLPSVGAGQVLSDMINSNVLPVSRLTEIFRQAKTSKIITNAHAVNNGQTPNLNNDINGDFFYVHTEEPDKCVSSIVQMLLKNIPQKWGYNPVKDVQILCPMKASAMGTEAMNKTLQYYLNPNIPVALHQSEIKHISYNELSEEDKKFRTRYPNEIPLIKGKIKMFTIGDKVMQIKNNYNKNVFNGDVGYIENIYTADKKVEIIFEDNEEGAKTVEYSYEELSEIVLAYACTVHKSQGSEYPVVIIPVMTQHYMMLQRKLLYTGITRGKKIVILVGQEKAIGLAVKGKNDEFNRFTKLKEWLILKNNK